MSPRGRGVFNATRCTRCFLPRGASCLCPSIPTLETVTHFILLRHASEMPRTTNTARWAHLALASSELIDYAATPEPFDEAPLRKPGTWVLFPDLRDRVPPPVAPARVIVLDGSWQQARRMLHRIPSLQKLPRISLPPPAPGDRLRRPPIASGMSTLEAVAAALELFGEPYNAQALRELHREAVARLRRLG